MSEYSTMEHILRIHDNHSQHLAIDLNDDTKLATYRHVEHMKTNGAASSYILGNVTRVNCSPKYSLRK